MKRIIFQVEDKDYELLSKKILSVCVEEGKWITMSEIMRRLLKEYVKAPPSQDSVSKDIQDDNQDDVSEDVQEDIQDNSHREGHWDALSSI